MLPVVTRMGQDIRWNFSIRGHSGRNEEDRVDERFIPGFHQGHGIVQSVSYTLGCSTYQYWLLLSPTISVPSVYHLYPPLLYHCIRVETAVDTVCCIIFCKSKKSSI